MSSRRRKVNKTEGSNKVNRQEGMLGVSASASAETEIVRSVTRSEDPLCDKLLWRISNEVTLQHIATKWSRGTQQVVATLSRDWQRAFQGRTVYDARVRSQSTETFFVVLSEICTALGPKYVDVLGETRSSWSEKMTLSLFSPREERWYKLPPVPGCHSGMPYGCKYVFLDGAMYFLGGTRSGKKYVPGPSAEVHVSDHIPSSAEVHVLDLAGLALEWKRCANMQVPRCRFNVGVMHGRIFVFGGEYEGTRFEVRNEVYDPRIDAWSWMAPIIPSVSIDTVFSVGQEFFVCCGTMSGFRPRNPARRNFVGDDEAGVCGDTKVVITAGARGPKLIITSDDDAEDAMDVLHEIIEKQLVHVEKRVRRFARLPNKYHAYLMQVYEESIPSPSNLFIRAYDPVKDEWRVFERESLGTDILDIVRPRHMLGLVRDDDATCKVLAWAVSL